MSESQPYLHATTEDAVRGWVAAMGRPAFVAVDTETSGWDPLADELLLVQVSAGPGRDVLVLDARQVHPRVLDGLLGDAGVLKVFHHGAFDLRFLARAGIRTRRVADTMLAQQLLDGGSKTAQGLSLAGLASFRLGMTLDKSVRSSFGEGGLTAAPGGATEAQLRYAADDAVATWGVFAQQVAELQGHGLTRVAQIEFGALPVLAGLALRGVTLDAPRWQRLVDDLEGRLPALEAQVQEALVTEDSPQDLFGPTPVNLDAAEQVREALARTGVEVASTSEGALRDHAGHPAVDALLAWRAVAKLHSAFGGDWAARAVHPRSGRVHSDWRQIVGAGRIACRDPNLLQIPKDAAYRSCFGGGPASRVVVADYSQQELRILAAVSGDEALRDVFRRGGDLHRATAAMVFATSEDAVAGAQRAAAKALNFGLVYGMGAPGFARATSLPLVQATAIMERYFAAFPRLATWLREVESAARRSGRVRTPFGRVRVLGDEAGSARLARNAPIQGAGADMTKLALAEVTRRLEAADVEGGPMLVVHDELVVEVDEAQAEAGAAAVEEGMLAAARELLGDVPAVVDVAVRERWGAVAASCD